MPIPAFATARSAPTAELVENCTGLTCAFTDQSSDDYGSVTDWSWSFRDGTASSSQNPSHGYADNPGSGSFKYRVKARNANGDSVYSNEVKI